jgi:threonine synthase
MIGDVDMVPLASERLSSRLNPELLGFSCISCGTEFPIADYFEGCPECLARGAPASLTPRIASEPPMLADESRLRMQRYAHWLPYVSWVSLGEGGTSCASFPALADEVSVKAVYIKNEGQNPSGSHKDRVSCLTVTRAADAGYGKIVAASSGNGGASLALYAAAAGLDCCVVSTPSLSPIFRQAIEMTGAELLTVADSLERWALIANMARSQGWFPATNYLNPPVGSNHFGLPGLATVAFELFEELQGQDIDAVLVPTSRGDLIWGLYAGFRQLRRLGHVGQLPRLFAVEPYPRIQRVLEGEPVTGSFPGTTAMLSIGGSTVTYQAVHAIRATGGGAIVVDEQSVARDQARLARHGCYAELSSAASLTGLERLIAEGKLSSGDTAVLIATSNGYKDLAAAGTPA